MIRDEKGRFIVMATKAQQVLEQMRGLESLKQEAINELLDERKKIDDMLAQLGYEESHPPKSSKEGGNTGKPRKKPEVCSICKFGTDPAHDGRHKGHRDQETKKPFTAKELESFGLTKATA